MVGERKGEEGKMKFYVNGWLEKRGYFKSLGHFSDEDISNMAESGKVVRRGNNEFWIVRGEE